MIISYNGKQINTKHYIPVSDDLREKVKKDFYQLPSKEEIYKQIKSIANGGVKMDKITCYYFRELMSKVQTYDSKWTVEDVFNSNDLFGIFYAKTQTNKKIYPENLPLYKNIHTAMRLGGKSYARFPAQFPIKSVDKILQKYNINNNWYDFSCGWGSRLCGALKNKVNYYGTDPNYLLVEKLKELFKDWSDTIDLNLICDIRAQGSENYISEWNSIMGLCFSSPPYFNLEDYKIGNQSYSAGTTYEQWIKNYLIPTIKNIKKYLIKNGIFAINVKNFDKFNLLDDCKDLISKNNFQLIEIEELVNNKRQLSTKELHNGNESILIFESK